MNEERPEPQTYDPTAVKLTVGGAPVDPAPVPETRAWKVTKGTNEQVVFDNRHGRRVIESVVRQASHRKRPKHKPPKRKR